MEFLGRNSRVVTGRTDEPNGASVFRDSEKGKKKDDASSLPNIK